MLLLSFCYKFHTLFRVSNLLLVMFGDLFLTVKKMKSVSHKDSKPILIFQNPTTGETRNYTVHVHFTNFFKSYII